MPRLKCHLIDAKVQFFAVHFIGNNGKQWIQGAGREERMGSPARILIVDDEPHVRAMLGATLDRQNYHTVWPPAMRKPST
jgi:hypothetical protein